MRKMKRQHWCLAIAALGLVGCDLSSDRSAYFEPPAATHAANAAGAPSYGTASGMGFYTGDAGQSGGMGTGLMGFNGVGSTGTSGTITSLPPNITMPPGLSPGPS